MVGMSNNGHTDLDSLGIAIAIIIGWVLIIAGLSIGSPDEIKYKMSGLCFMIAMWLLGFSIGWLYRK